MEINFIHQEQFREKIDRKARLKRVERGARVAKIRDIKDSEKDREESKNNRQEVVADVVIKQTDKESGGTTIELTEKASRIADRYEAQNHMMGQHIGHIDKLRSSLNNVSEKEAIEEVKKSKAKQAEEAYKKSANYKQTEQSTYEDER